MGFMACSRAGVFMLEGGPTSPPQIEITRRLEQLEEDLGHKGGSSRRGHRPSPGDPRKRLVLDTPCNSGYSMQCPLVTSLTALGDPRTGGPRPSKGKMLGGECRRTGEARWPGTCLRSGTESE